MWTDAPNRHTLRRGMGKKIGCYIGFHDWKWVHTPDGDRRQACVNCGKERPDLSGRTGIGGG